VPKPRPGAKLSEDPWLADGWFPGPRGIGTVLAVVIAAAFLAVVAAVVTTPRSDAVQPTAPAAAFVGVAATGLRTPRAIESAGGAPIKGVTAPAGPTHPPASTVDAPWQAAPGGWAGRRPRRSSSVAWLAVDSVPGSRSVGARVVPFGTAPDTGVGPALRLGPDSTWVLARSGLGSVALTWWRHGEAVPLVSIPVPVTAALDRSLPLGLQVVGPQVVLWAAGQVIGIVHLPRQHGALATGLAALPTQTRATAVAQLLDVVAR
jgi:hypothetical protein